jgi:hypothetical protein
METAWDSRGDSIEDFNAAVRPTARTSTRHQTGIRGKVEEYLARRGESRW